MSASQKFLEDICRAIGHEWNFPTCSRCGYVQVLTVILQGTVLRPDVDYTVASEKIIFATPVPGTVNIIIGQQGAPWGIKECKLSGGATITLT